MSPGSRAARLRNRCGSIRLDGTPMGTELPKGWEGSFDLERGNSAVDDFIAAAEQQYFNGTIADAGHDVPVCDRDRRIDLAPTSTTA